jgi:hypothetical protein
MSINLVFLGVATTASPLFLLVSVLMLAQSQRLREATALAVGWFLSIGACAAAVLLLGSALPTEDGHPNHHLMGAIDLALGVVLAGLAVRLRRRYRRDPQAAVPKWLDRVGSMSVIVACGLGMFLPPTVLSFAAMVYAYYLDLACEQRLRANTGRAALVGEELPPHVVQAAHDSLGGGVRRGFRSSKVVVRSLSNSPA